MSVRDICWERDRVQLLFDVEASALADTSWDLFASIHYPMKRIEVLGGTYIPTENVERTEQRDGGHRDFIHENALLDSLRKADRGNWLVGLRGAPGSGKSHLIRWLEYELKDDERFTLVAIPRDINSLGSVLKRIADKTGIVASFEEVDHRSIDRTILVRTLIQNVEMFTLGSKPKLRDRREFNLLFNRDRGLAVQLERLVKHVTDKYLDARAARTFGYDDIPVPELDADTLKEWYSELGPEDTAERADEFVDELRIAFASAWMQYLRLGNVDLKELLREADERTRSTGKRLVLLLEDVTSFEVLHRDLLAFLFTLPAGQVSAVLGWTTGYEKAQGVDTYIRDRLALHLSLTFESERGEITYAFLDPKDALGLARRYLDAIRKQSCGECPIQANCWPLFEEGLYPFNRTALQQFWDNMVDSHGYTRRQTPRIFLSRVMRVLLEQASSAVGFPRPDKIAYLQPLETPLSLQRFQRDHREYVEARKWYTVDPSRDDLPLEAYGQLAVEVPSEAEKQERPGPDGEEEKPDKGPGDGIAAPPDTGQQAQEEYKRFHREVDNWADRKATPGNVDQWRRFVADLLGDIGCEMPVNVNGLIFGAQDYRGVHIEGGGAEARDTDVVFRLSQDSRYATALLGTLGSANILNAVDTQQQAASAIAYSKDRYELGLGADHRRRRLTLAEFALGLVFEFLVLDAAFRGVSVSASLLDGLRGVRDDQEERGQPYLSPTSRQLRDLLKTNRDKFRVAFRELAYTGPQTVLDAARLETRLSEARQVLREGEVKAFSTIAASKEVKDLGQMIHDVLPAALRFFQIGIDAEEERVREAAACVQDGTLFDTAAKEAMDQLRFVFSQATDPPTVFRAFKPYDDELRNLGSGLPIQAGGDLTPGIQRLQEAEDTLEDDDVYRRLSAICAVPYQSLHYGMVLVEKSREALQGVRRELQRMCSATGGVDIGSARKQLESELERVTAAMDEIKRLE